MAQFGEICLRPVSARFLGGSTIVSSFIAQSARFRLPAGSMISAINQTAANDAVFADIDAQIPNSRQEETFTTSAGFRQERINPGSASSDAQFRTVPFMFGSRSVFTLTQDYETAEVSRLNDLSDLNSGLSLQIWGNGDPNNPATATVVEGGNFPPIEIESVVTIEGAELESGAWFTRRINNLSSVRRLEFDVEGSIYNTDNDGNATPRNTLLAAQIRFEGESTWRRLVVGDGLSIISDTGTFNSIRITGDANDNGRGTVSQVIETAAAAIPIITDPLTGDSFQATFQLSNNNFNPMRVTFILPDFNILERSRGSVEIRFRTQARDEGGRNRNAIRLENIKVVRIDSDESREDYRFQHRLGLNLVASATLSGTPEAVNALITSESFYWDPSATLADRNGNEIIYQTDPNGDLIRENGNLVVHPDNATLPRNTSTGNVPESDLPSDGRPFMSGYWSMNNPRYQTATGHTDAAYRVTSNPAELLLTFALGQRENARPGTESSNRLIWGLGLPISRIDLASLLAWRDYCNENELEFNGFFNESRTGLDILDAITAVGHGLVSWADGRLTISIDEPYAVPSYCIDESRCVARSFSGGFEMVRKYDAIEAVYFNSDNDYQEETIREDAENLFRGSGAVANERFFGITNLTQARNYARRYMRLNTFRSPIEYTFRLPADEFYLTIGDTLLMRHRFFGDQGRDWHKLKVFAVSYSSNEEITVQAAPDTFTVWLDRTEVENRLIDFDNHLPLTIDSQIREDNFISTTDGTNWDGQLSVLHNGLDFRVNSLDRVDDNGRDIVSLNFDPDADYVRGVTSTAFEYTGFPTLEPSEEEDDGRTWTFPTPLSFTARGGKNFQIASMSLDRTGTTPAFIIRDLITNGKVLADYAGDANLGTESFRIQVFRPDNLIIPLINRVLSTATLDDEGNVSISLDDNEVNSIEAFASTSDLFLRIFTGREAVNEIRSATATFDIVRDADGNPVLDADGNEQLANDLINVTFDDPIVFSTTEGTEVLDFNFTGVSYRPAAGTFVLRSGQFVDESSTPEADQLQRLINGGISIDSFRGEGTSTRRFLGVTFVSAITVNHRFAFTSGQLEISFLRTSPSINIADLIDVLGTGQRIFTIQLTAGGFVFHDSAAVRATNLLQPTATSWSLFPNIIFSANNQDFRITGLEFVDRPGESPLIRISDALITDRTSPVNYGPLDIRIGDVLLDIGRRPGSAFRFVDPMGEPVDLEDVSSTTRAEVNFGGSQVAQLQALRTAIEENRNQEISIEIVGVTQPAINPLTRAMSLSQGSPLNLEMARFDIIPDPDNPGETLTRIRRDANGNEERVPLRITPIGGGDGRRFSINFEARDPDNSGRIRYLSDTPIPANTEVRIGLPSNTTDNVKFVDGAVYETRCPVYLPTSNQARILLARGNKDADPMLAEIDSAAGGSTGLYAIDFYRNQVPAGTDADGANVSAHSIVFRTTSSAGAGLLATLFRTGYTLEVNGLVSVSLLERNTSLETSNLEVGPDGETYGVVFNANDEESTGINSLSLPRVDPDAEMDVMEAQTLIRNAEIERRAALLLENFLTTLTATPTVHVLLRRNSR